MRCIAAGVSDHVAALARDLTTTGRSVMTAPRQQLAYIQASPELRISQSTSDAIKKRCATLGMSGTERSCTSTVCASCMLCGVSNAAIPGGGLVMLSMKLLAAASEEYSGSLTMPTHEHGLTPAITRPTSSTSSDAVEYVENLRLRQ